MFYITKKAGKKKDAIRVKSEKSIPLFLKKAITIKDGKVYLTCVEGTECCELGKVIGYEKTSSLKSGYNCWVVGNADTALVEKDGEFFVKPKPVACEVMTYDYPAFLQGANITTNGDHWVLQTSWGALKGKPFEAFWLLYGQDENGNPDAAILTPTEKSFDEYYLCDSAGNREKKLTAYYREILLPEINRMKKARRF